MLGGRNLKKPSFVKHDKRESFLIYFIFAFALVAAFASASPSSCCCGPFASARQGEAATIA